MTDGAAAWRGAVAACLVGAERTVPIALPEGLAEGVTTDGPAGLLRAVAALGVWRMAGAAPDLADSAPLDVVAETLPECSPAAAARLEALLAETRRHPATLRGEWCRLAAAAGLRAPDGLAPALLHASRGAPWAAVAEAVLGARGPWLRRLAVSAAEDVPDLSGRLAALRLSRQSGADAARTSLAAGWEDDAADTRAALLATLETGLSMADEPFLEARLDDRAASVRTAAARLLERLPASRYAARMLARARAAVHFDAGTLTIVLPKPDAAMRRDGLVTKGSGLAESVLTWLAAAAPLEAWADIAPTAWLAAARDGDTASALLIPGWAAAAARERAMPWLQALLDLLIPFKPKGAVAFSVGDAIMAVAKALPAAALEIAMTSALHRAATAAKGLSNAELENPVALRLPSATMASTTFLLGYCAHPWSASFTADVVAWIAGQVGPGGPFHGIEGHWGGLRLDPLALQADPAAALPPLAALAAACDASAPALRRALDEAAETLRFRAGMQQELTA